MKNFKGKAIKFLRYSNMSDDIVAIEIEDYKSGCRFVELLFTIEQFGKFMAMSTDVDCDVVFYPDCPIGKVREVKEEIIECEYLCTKDDHKKKELLKPFEVDGWTGHEDDLGNHHRRTKEGYKVTFHRYVEDEE